MTERGKRRDGWRARTAPAKWRLRASGALLVAGAVALIVADGCGHDLVSHGGATPPWLARPLAASASAAPSGTEGLTPAGAAADSGAAVFDPETVRPVLADPRLAAVQAQLAKEADLGAAKQLADILRKSPPGGEDEPRWHYQLGRLRLRAGDPLGAAAAFDRAAAIDWVLADYARFLAGDLLVKAGQPAEGLARLEQVKAGTALDDELLLATAAGHAANHDVDQASGIWSAYLARQPRPKGWQNVALRFAKALLNQPSVAHAEKAVEVARLVIYESQSGKGAGEARELEEQALSTIPSAEQGSLTKPASADLMFRARALAESAQGREALAASEKVIALLSDESPSELACEGYIAKGKALELLKRQSEAADAFGTAIDRCSGQPRRVVALFLGGRAALRSGQPSTARKRLAEVETAFPDHSLADDARLHGAEAAKNLGDVATFTSMLLTIADDYPKGDMVDDALFMLAHDRIDAGDWSGAVAPLARAIKLQARGRPYWAEGRPQYYLARARLALGAKKEGLRLLESVISDFPLSYYMLHAFARLHSIDAARAEAAVAAAVKAEPEGELVIEDHGELHRPEFLRAAELVRQGDGERALAELDRLGVRDKTAHPSLLWAAAFLLAKIDAPVESHGLLRASPGLWKEHYPAGIWRALWEVAYPRPFVDIVQKEVARSAIPEHLAYAIMREESAFQAQVVSHAGAHGLMQLILPTAKTVARPLGMTATKKTLKTPEVNIALGCRFLSQLEKKFPYNPVLAIPGYNAGPGAPAQWVDDRPGEDFDLWVEKIPYRETREYTKRVIQSMAAYAMLYGSGMQDALMQLPLAVKPGDTTATAGD